MLAAVAADPRLQIVGAVYDRPFSVYTEMQFAFPDIWIFVVTLQKRAVYDRPYKVQFQIS
jgi:hypothetical protein